MNRFLPALPAALRRFSCPKRIRSFSSDTSTEGMKESSDTATRSADTAEAKIAQLQDSYLRCLADMENLRTRTRKEVESASSFAIQKFCKDVVGVADVLELALGSVRGDPKTAALLAGKEAATGEADTPDDSSTAALNAAMSLSKEDLVHRLKDLSIGLSMTLSELVSVFLKHGLTPVDPIHQKFDPNFHMALFEVPSAEHEAGTVLSVQKKGYLLNHRVIRPAAVGVSKKP
jgi:molecular chaperone GrpE